MNKKSFCVESFISNEETPVTTVAGHDVTVTNIKDGVVIGTVNLPTTSSTPLIPLQWDLTGKVIEEGKAMAESKLNLVFKELPGKDFSEVGKDMFIAIAGIQKSVENQHSEDNQRRKTIARSIVYVVSEFINSDRIIERRDKEGVDDSWVIVDKPEWNWEKYEYRVKARPYTQEELIGILRDKSKSPLIEHKASGDVVLIGSIQSTGVYLVEHGSVSFSKLLEDYLWLDGSTCGVELVD